MFIYFGILQVLLILSTECYSININYKENKTANIKITIPISSNGIGPIRVDEITLGDEYRADRDPNITIPFINEQEPEIEVTLTEAVIDDNDINDTIIVPNEEPVIEGPVRASGTINILGNFGSMIPGEPVFHPIFRPAPLYPIYPPAENAYNDTNSSDALEHPEDTSSNYSGPILYPYYRPVPLYPIFPAVMKDPSSSEESDQPIIPVTTNAVPPPYPMYRPLPFYPVHPPISNDPNKTTDEPPQTAQSKEPLTLNDDTRQLLRNLMLLNIAHQSNIPCEVIPVPPTNKYAPDESDPSENGIEDRNNGAPSIVPVSGSVKIVATSL